MAEHLKKYRLECDLPRYPKGSVVYHEYQELPSKFNDGTYFTDGEWYQESSLGRVMVPDYVAGVIKRCISDQNVKMSDWVTLLEEDNGKD